MRTRPALLWHRWFGLLGGVWLLVIALTGSVLVFHEEIDHALNPDWFTASAGPVALALHERTLHVREQLQRQLEDIEVTLAEIAQHEDRCRRLLAQARGEVSATATPRPRRRAA